MMMATGLDEGGTSDDFQLIAAGIDEGVSCRKKSWGTQLKTLQALMSGVI